MQYFKMISTALLVGVLSSACSAESTSDSEDSAIVSSSQALNAKKALNGHTAEARRAHAAAAAASLDTLAGLVASDRAEKRGFKSADEARSGKLSTAVPVFMVGLDKLVAYDTSVDPETLLLDLAEAMYPISVDGEVRSSVTVRKRSSGAWEASEFGRPNLAKVVHGRRIEVTKRRGVAEDALKLVSVPALGAKFLGHDEAGELMLSPVTDIVGTELKAGDTRSAREVFAMLRPKARAVDPNSLN